MSLAYTFWEGTYTFSKFCCNGAISVPERRKSGNKSVPKIIIRSNLPRVTTKRAGVTPIAMIPASGKIPFPNV